MDRLSDIAPVFVTLAHDIVWATAATINQAGEPVTRILHPIWEWDGTTLQGWIATSPQSPKAAHLEHTPHISLTYWRPNHDTLTVACNTSWDHTDAGRRDGWQRFADGPAPVGYDPSIISGWESPESPTFGILCLEPVAVRVMEGSVMLQGTGRPLIWKA